MRIVRLSGESGRVSVSVGTLGARPVRPISRETAYQSVTVAVSGSTKVSPGCIVT